MTYSEMSKVAPSILTRVYNAPKQLVYDAWTKVEHLQKWMFPQKGFTCDYVTADIRPGGSSLHKMTTPTGHQMWLLTKYDDMTPPDTIVFRQYMSNEAGEILPHPQMPNWPKDMRVTINLEEAEGKTSLELVWEPVEPTVDEIEAFESTREQHGNGWGAGLEQLTNYLNDLS